MSKFKTPILEKFYFSILQQQPSLESSKDKLKRMLQNIKLPDKPPSYEYFYHELDLWGCGSLSIIWNIEKILKYTPAPSDIQYFTTQELLTLIDFNSPLTKEVMASLLPKGSIKHRGEYIILALLPGFPQFTIIDGNHRVLEEITNPHCIFKCFMIGDERILDFLEPNSCQFFKSIYFINKIIKG